MYSCARDEIDPSVSLPEIAQEILSLQSSLLSLWKEYADIAVMSGLVDSVQEPSEIMSELESTMMDVAENGAHSSLMTHTSDISWVERYGNSKRMNYPKEGDMTYTVDTGETFSVNE